MEKDDLKLAVESLLTIPVSFNGIFSFTSLLASCIGKMHMNLISEQVKDSFRIWHNGFAKKLALTSSNESIADIFINMMDLDIEESILIEEIMKNTLPEIDGFIFRLLLNLVELGDYDARSRCALLNVYKKLGNSHQHYTGFLEKVVAFELATLAEECMRKESPKEEDKAKKMKRYAAISAGAIGMGAVVGLTAGFAAPIIVPALAGIFGAGVSTALAGTVGAAVIGSLFGATGAGLSGYKIHKRSNVIKEFEFVCIREDHCMGVTICISGWLEEQEDFIAPWNSLCNLDDDIYALKFESQIMLDLGKSFKTFFENAAASTAVQGALKLTFLNALISSIIWPVGLIQLGSLIDNPWSLATNRARKAGIQLAEVLSKRIPGKRPVSLVGYSIGALVIFHALLEMQKTKKDNLGIIGDVVLMGLPHVCDNIQEWADIRELASGRFLNVYCETDLILGFLFRAMSASFQSIAGLSRIPLACIESINVSHLIEGHLEYKENLSLILRQIEITQ